MSGKKRSQFNFLLTPGEYKKLKWLADLYGTSMARVVRYLIAQERARLEANPNHNTTGTVEMWVDWEQAS